MSDYDEPMLSHDEQPYIVDQPTAQRDDIAYIIIVDDRVSSWAKDFIAMTRTFPEIFEREPEELWLHPVWYRRAVTVWRSGGKGSEQVEVDMERRMVRVGESGGWLRIVEDSRIPEGEIHVVAPPRPAVNWEFPA